MSQNRLPGVAAFAFACILALLWPPLIGRAAGQAPPPDVSPVTGGPKLQVVLVGDSTVASKGGWGDAFGRLLSPKASCLNLARGGQSSKSFYDQGLWQKALATKPDFIFIQFGHNDNLGKGPTRATDPDTTYRVNMIRYVEQARANGSKPILVTSLARRQFDKQGRFDKTGRIDSLLAPYVESVKKVASELNVPLIDLHARSIEFYDRLGESGCQKQLSPYDASKKTYDGTHLTEKGGALVAELVAAEVRRAVPELAACLPQKPASAR